MCFFVFQDREIRRPSDTKINCIFSLLSVTYFHITFKSIDRANTSEMRMAMKMPDAEGCEARKVFDERKHQSEYFKLARLQETNEKKKKKKSNQRYLQASNDVIFLAEMKVETCSQLLRQPIPSLFPKKMLLLFHLDVTRVYSVFIFFL